MKIVLCGCSGKMGQAVTERAAAANAEIVCGVDLFAKPAPYPVYPSFADVRESADVLIDFSSREGLEERLAFAEARGIPAVLGATGYTPEDLALLDKAAKRIPLFQTGNFSLGINLLEYLVQTASAVLGDFDVEIVERHHNRKKDAPSGTALMLAAAAEAGRDGALERVYGRHGMVGPREKGEIGIHAVRGGNLVGEHEVMFAGEDEIVTLSHSARSRTVFADGALKAARWVLGRPAGRYRMQDLVRGLLQ